MNRKAGFGFFVNAVVLCGLLVACAAPTPEVVEVTVVTEKEVEVVVEKEVPVEVTVEIAREVEITPAPTPSGYHQSPMLDERVASGELPRVEERLPLNPLVMIPREELGETIGQYGGTLSVMGTNPGSPESDGAEWGAGGVYEDGVGHVAYYDMADRRFYPDVADRWELSDDFRTLTIHLREGIRWSDGELLTTEDVRFWWEDIVLNENLTPVMPAYYAPTGEPMQVIIDDPLTFRFVYPEPYVAAADRLADLRPWEPKHYLSQWHIKYNEDANELAQSEGFTEWWEAVLARSNEWGNIAAEYLPEVPCMRAYIPHPADSTGNVLSERNPYYWKVDPEGKQLPYVDYYERVLVGNRELLEAKAVAGDYNFGGAWADLANYPLLIENAEEAGYNVRLYPSWNWGGSISWAFNYTSKDPVLKEIFNDLRFRQAMSYAIDRAEYNEIFNLGLSEIRQACPPAHFSFHDPEMCKKYIEYDVDKANELLDDMGLEWDANHEWRLRPDGQRLTLYTEIGLLGFRSGEFDWLVGEWEDVGVEINWKEVDQALYTEHLLANDLDIPTYGAGGPDEPTSHANYLIRLVPPWHWNTCCAMAGLAWYDWWQSGGERGEEPPEIIQDLQAVMSEWLAEPLGTEHYMELARELVEINAENLWYFVIVGPAPGVSHAICATAAADNVRNLRDPEANGGWWDIALLWIEE